MIKPPSSKNKLRDKMKNLSKVMKKHYVQLNIFRIWYFDRDMFYIKRWNSIFIIHSGDYEIDDNGEVTWSEISLWMEHWRKNIVSQLKNKDYTLSLLNIKDNIPFRKRDIQDGFVYNLINKNTVNLNNDINVYFGEGKNFWPAPKWYRRIKKKEITTLQKREIFNWIRKNELENISLIKGKRNASWYW